MANTIDSLHAMMMQLHENTKKKKSSKRSKKKRTLPPSESPEEEEKQDALDIEISSKHKEPSDSCKGGSQRINELDRLLDAVVNWEKLQEAGCD